MYDLFVMFVSNVCMSACISLCR